MTPNESENPRTPGTGESALSTCCSNDSRSGQPAIVSTIVSETTPSALETSRTMSSSVDGALKLGVDHRLEGAENGVAVRFHQIPRVVERGSSA